MTTQVTHPPRFDAIDLSQLPAPEVVETLDYEAILAELKADFKERWPDYDVEMLESDPAIKLLEVAAFRELVLRARVNDAARAVMLAFAKSSDLDHLGALFKTSRKLIQEADPTINQPEIYESDREYRARVQLAPEALSTAGPIGAYIYHALSAHPDVRDVGVYSPEPGSVHVLPLVRADDGIPSEEVLDAVRDRLMLETVKPLTDSLAVRAPERIDFTVEATLVIPHGPDSLTVKQAAEAALATYLSSRHRVGRTVYRSGITAALSVASVETIVLASPAQDVIVGPDQVAWATDISISIQVAD
jgi:phage-related baseplate assembly protein